MNLSNITQEKSQQLSIPEEFTYQFFQENRYKISQKQPYESLCNNGWIKLYTMPTRAYWHAQNELGHKVPDWKFHISVKHEQVKIAWNLVVAVFLHMKCRAGMKTVYLKESAGTKGREITVYIVKHTDGFKGGIYEKEFGVCLAEEHSEDFWKAFVAEIESVLASHEIQSNGLAEGDLKIGKYTSLRNQAFINTPTSEDPYKYEYPCDEAGWNPLKHTPPFNIANMIKHIKNANPSLVEQTKQEKHRPMYYFTLPIMMISAGYLLMKRLHS